MAEAASGFFGSTAMPASEPETGFSGTDETGDKIPPQCGKAAFVDMRAAREGYDNITAAAFWFRYGTKYIV